ncbi:MAG TPA: MmgE/PrpD family protein, partial [Burkholderiales bacterium]|nr:MmgE/PrpD family protein [Burkholderiales bacterium]
LAALSIDELPGSVLSNARWCFLDSLGCGLFGSGKEWTRILAAEIDSDRAQGPCSIFGYSRRTAAPAAALCNGTGSHGFELDDLLDEAIVHPGAIVIPAALAAAEASGASGADIILGVVAGYEVMNRVGLALGMEPAHRGFHKTSLAGPLGAAVAAGIVIKLDEKQLNSAVGLACSAASGIKTFAVGEGGGMMKRMHAGRAAEAGVRMAQLAARGFTGPPNAVESRFGLLEVFGGAGANPEVLDRDLGKSWAVDNVYVKVYPCCAWIQASVQQLVALRGASPLDPAKVKRIRIGTNSYARRLNGTVAPLDTMGAQYSIPYCAALALTGDPADPAMYADAVIADPARRDLAHRVELVPDDEMEAVYPRHYGSRVRVELVGGEARESTVLDPHGMPVDPCTEAERIEKFRRLASSVLAAAQVDRIIETVRALEREPSIETLSHLLTPRAEK